MGSPVVCKAPMASRVSGACVGRVAQPFRATRAGHVPVSRNMSVSAFKVTLLTPEGDKTIECPEDTYILQAAQQAKIKLPYTCLVGTCPDCAGKVLSGTVDQSDQSYLNQKGIDAGYVLTCVACPTSDVVIQTNMHLALVESGLGNAYVS